MKKISVVMVGIILVLVFAVSAWGASQEIPIVKVSGSANSLASNPVQYLTDEKLDTAWLTDSQPGSGWVELQLQQEVLIDGLRFYGAYRGFLTVEYWQNNGWHSFLAARDLDGSMSNQGWNLLDLSYDRVVSDRVRLWLTGNGPGNLGGIGEVQALGRRVQELVRRIDPQTAGSAELFDHNTYTGWKMNGGASEVLVDLGSSINIDRIKLYCAPAALGTSGRVTVQYQFQGLWWDIPGLVSWDVSNSGTSWRSFELSAAAIGTSQLRLLLQGDERLGALKEVEIWGRNSDAGTGPGLGSEYLECGRAAFELTGSVAGNYQFTLAQPIAGALNLHIAGTGNPANSQLNWELNGRLMGILAPAAVVNGITLYRSPLTSRDLRIGPNFIRIKGAGITIHDCRVEISKEAEVSIPVLDSLTDRLGLTPAAGSETLDLGAKYHLDELQLNYLGEVFSGAVWVERDGHWAELSSTRNEPGIMGGTMVYLNPGLVTRIKVTGGSSDSPTELEFKGSRVNDGPPRVRILAPVDGALLSLSQWEQTKLTGTVDNPEAEVRVNGRVVPLVGTGFEISLSSLGLNPGEVQTIEVVASDSLGGRSSDQISIGIGLQLGITLNLPNQVIYTKESQMTVSGQVWVSNCQVFVNGVEVPLVNRTFSTVVSLEEGYNPILVKATFNSYNFSSLNLREVVRSSVPPYLKVISPTGGQMTNAETMTVSGYIDSLQPVTLTVNGQPVTVAGGYFYSNPVTLQEGANQITVIATDKSGLTSRQELVVYRDRTAPSITEILPVEGANLNTTVINVNGIITDASPVSVLVNGVAANISAVGANQDSPSTRPWTININGVEGWNDLKIEARDAAGNVTAITRRVFIDTKPPAAFAPEANATGWTQNSRPTITFGTTDDESGIDHYEIAVSGGAWTTTVTSPYQFSWAIPDGEQTIQVKAVDKAGNETVGEVKVYIDTTPPAAPEGYEVISGIARVTINWLDPRGEIDGYRLERTPAFPGDSFREIRRTMNNEDIKQYIDLEVTPGGDYTYTLKAIDHAGNYGAATIPVNVEVGITTQDIATTGGVVKFDDCAVTLEENAITNPGKVVITENNEPIPDNDYAVSVSPTYNLTLQNESGAAIETEFAAPVTLTMSYAGFELPEGFDPGDLGLYWYNEEGGYWEKLDHVTWDFAAQTLTAPLSHFSDYSMMASKYVSPSLDSYYDLGISPFGAYFQDNVESISPSSGGLSVSATDLKLPGRNGFDLVITRLYDSGTAQQEKILENNGEAWRKTPIDTFGYGWSLNIPWIERTDKGKFLRLPEGQTIKISLHHNKFEYHEGVHFILIGYSTLIMKDGTKYEFDSSGRVVSRTEPSGINCVRYEYQSSKPRQIYRIIDSAGRIISFTYKQVGTKELIGTMSTGIQNLRTWKYKYTDQGVLHEAIDPKDRTTVYNYEEKTDLKSGSSANWYYYISWSSTAEGYQPSSSSQSSSGNFNKLFSFNFSVLKSITYPTGAASVYEYILKDQSAHEEWNEHSRSESHDIFWDYHPDVDEEGKIVKRWFSVYVTTVREETDQGSITVAGSRLLYLSQTVLGKVVKYDYTLNPASGSLRGNNYIPAGSYISTCEINEGMGAGDQFTSIRKTKETYRQMIKDGSYKLVDSPTYEQTDKYKGNILVSRLVEAQGAPVAQLASYEYDLKKRAVTKEQQRRGNKDTVAGSPSIYEITTTYDDWGNPLTRLDGSSKLEETWTYYTREFPVGSNKYNLVYAVKTQVKNNWDPIERRYSVATTTYHYQDLWKPDLITVEAGTLNQETKYEYYPISDPNQGALKKMIAPNGLATEYVYDSQGLVKEKICRGILNADNQLAEGSPGYEQGTIATKYQYDADTGMKLSETDARGSITSYQYDALNRITKVTLPDEGGGSPYREYKFHDEPTDLLFNTCEYYNENRQLTLFKFDGVGRLTDIVKDPNGLKITTTYHYDDLGRIETVTDPLLRVTTYAYDGFNRVTQVTFPMSNAGDSKNPCATLGYDDLTNTVTITDENGGQVTERSDWANRLVAAQQQCNYPGEATQNYDWAFTYNSVGNKLRQMDPLYHPTTQLFDELGRLKEVKLPEINVTENGDTAPTGQTPSLRYGYDQMGNKTSETDARGNTVSYDYDLLGRLIKVTTTSFRLKDLKTGQTETVTAVTKTYYDAAGNKVQTTDANNHSWYYTYSARGLLLSGKDPEENLTQYRYDPMGNKIAVIDPRNKEVAPNTWYTIENGQVILRDPRMSQTFTTWYLYDNQNRPSKTILPDKTPPVNPYTTEEDNPYTVITYYADGNKKTEQDATGLVTSYTYTPRGWVEKVSVGGQLKVKYVYDAKGNQKEIRSYYDASNYTSTVNLYDSLDRMRQVTYPGNITEKYTYDAVGNRKTVTSGTNSSTTVYDYNSLGWLTRVQDPLYNATEYWYDLNGNQVAQISPNQLKTVNYYDELNRLQKQKDSLGYLTKFSYDDAGNRWKMLDRRGTEWSCEYYKNNALWQLTVTGDDPTYQVTYEYDAAGNRTLVKDNGNTNRYVYDEQSRLTDIERKFDDIDVPYTTNYQYTNQRLSGIMYPGAKSWLEYKYNNLNQVNEVVGFTLQNGITYDGDGVVNGMKYQNGVTVSYKYDAGRRLMDLVAMAPGKELVNNHYQYWDNSTNIKYINDKYYEYDKNNQLTKAVTPGKFLEDKVTAGSSGVFVGDVLGTSGLIFSGDQRALVSVDTKSTSIGLDFGTVAPGVKKILFVPDQAHQVHRVNQKTFDLFVSSDNLKYTLVGRDKWEYAKDDKGIITITLKERLATRYLKIHVWYDNRDVMFVTQDKATFLNELGKMLQVYQEGASRTEEYQYDPEGNRTLTKITLVHTELNNSLYIKDSLGRDSDRLRTDGKYAYDYDDAGNLKKKGNTYILNGNDVTFTTSGEGVEYWDYTYDLLNRLTAVTKNGTLIAEYEYDPDGLRVVKRAHGETIHYLFEGTEPIYEKDVTRGKIHSYIYALGKHLARVDGEMDTYDNLRTRGVPVYFYTTDHLGSIKAVTDRNGTTVFQADHLPFGERYGESKTDPNFDEWHSFTGKEFDPDTGLYYFNARWYDQETGRFISEDPAQDGNNWYAYGVNNPLIYNDPTGLAHQDADGNWVTDPGDYEWNYDYNCYNFWVNNDDFFAYGDSGWWNDSAKLNLAWNFLDVVDFNSEGIFDRTNNINAGGINIPYYESRRVQTVQAQMCIPVTGWYDERTRMAAGALQEIYGVKNANDSTFDAGTWRAMNSILTSPDRFWKYHEFYQKYKDNLSELKLGNTTVDLLVNIAIFGLGKTALSSILSVAGAGVLTNPLPSNGVYAIVMPKEFANALKIGKIKTLSGGSEAWITAGSDLEGITTVKGAAQRLTLVDETGNLRLSGDAIVYFRIKDISGIASPVYRSNPGYLYGGLTGGGAREWLIASNSNIEIIKIVILK